MVTGDRFEFGPEHVEFGPELGIRRHTWHSIWGLAWAVSGAWDLAKDVSGLHETSKLKKRSVCKWLGFPSVRFYPSQIPVCESEPLLLSTTTPHDLPRENHAFHKVYEQVSQQTKLRAFPLSWVPLCDGRQIHPCCIKLKRCMKNPAVPEHVLVLLTAWVLWGQLSKTKGGRTCQPPCLLSSLCREGNSLSHTVRHLFYRVWGWRGVGSSLFNGNGEWGAGTKRAQLHGR